MAYPNLSSENEPGAFTVELTEKNQPINQGPQVGFEGMEDKDAPHGEQRKLITTSDTNLTRRPRLNTAERVS